MRNRTWFWIATTVAGLLGFGMVAAATLWLKSYGWALFVATPFVQGLVAVLIYGWPSPREYWPCFAVATAASLVTGIVCVLAAMEGIICLIMAAPLACPLAWLGGTIGWALIRMRWKVPGAISSTVLLAVIMPVLMGADVALKEHAPLLAVRTTVGVDATPEQVWQNVVAFTELPEPTEWMFRAGIAYPIRAEMHGIGVGAERHCVFSTGAFVEPITAWDEPRLLAFSVTSNPPPMEEWTPYRHVHPPHLGGFLASERGQFLLEALPDGRTKLEGTTWYRHHMWPVAYWQTWSDHIIHNIHNRVLTHIKRRSEAGNDAMAAVGR
jgi:hypothetical protein